MNDGAGQDDGADRGECGAFRGSNRGDRPPAALASDNDGLALAGLFHGQPAVLPVGFDVLLLGMATDIHPVDFHHAGQRGADLFGADRFPQLMGQDERRLVLHVQVTAELQGGHAFDRVHEQADRGQIVPDRQLAAGEDGPAGDAELLPACGALPNAAGLEGVNLGAFASRAERRAAVVGKADRLKPGMRFVVRHPHDGAKAQRAGFCGKEEVLCHLVNLNEYR